VLSVLSSGKGAGLFSVVESEAWLRMERLDSFLFIIN
jgi:hypothetical protein